MHILRFKNLSIYIYVIFFIIFCQSTPIVTKLPGGYDYESQSFYLDIESSHTIQGEESSGNSSRLYAGIIENGDTASIILRINSDSLIHHPFCLSDSIINFQISLSSINQLGIQIDSTILDTLFDSNKLSISLIQNFINWNENDLLSNDDIADITTTTIQEILPYEFLDYNIKINFPDMDMLHEKICIQENDIEILLEYSSETDVDNNILNLVEFRSSDHNVDAVAPKVNLSYFIDYDSLFNYNKYSIIETENIHNPIYNTYFIGLDSSNQWGIFYSFNIENNFPMNLSETLILDSLIFIEDVIDSTDTYNDILLSTINIELNQEIIDSIYTLKFNLLDIKAYISDIDPMGDNWYDNLEKDLFTENNLQYDSGELFYDFGIDNCPDSLELGDQFNCVSESSLSIFNPYGSEGNNELDWIDLNGNGIWNEGDYGEEWKDLGLDGCSDEFETGEIENNCFDTPNENYYQGDDPNGDNFNIDPNNDNFESTVNPLGTEKNGNWDQNENFLDFGSDGLPESIIGFSDENGTEGNGIWDIGEPYEDVGMDGLPDSLEFGFNDLGTEGNDKFDGENEFNDCGEDNYCDEDGDNDHDNYIIDPNLDNWNIIDSTLTDAPYGYHLDYVPKLDWNDLNNNGLWDDGEGEEWFDWGIDQILDENEVFIDSLIVEPNLDDIYYEIDLNNQDEVDFESPAFDNSIVNVWVSKIERISTMSFNINISINSNIQLKGLSYKLNHEKFVKNNTITVFKNESINKINSEKLFQDATLLLRKEYNELDLDTTLQINYFNNLYAKLSFTGLNDFIKEKEGVIFSPEYTNLILYTDQENSLIDSDGMWIYINSMNIEDMNMLALEKIFSYPDSIIIPMGQILQQFESGQYNDFEGFIINTDGIENNFSTYRINLSLLPRIDIFYTQ